MLTRAGALRLPEGLQRPLAEHTGAGRRVVAFGEARGGLPTDPAAQPPPTLAPRALVVLEGYPAPRRRRDHHLQCRDQQVDLKLISGHARETVTAVSHAVGCPATGR